MMHRCLSLYWQDDKQKVTPKPTPPPLPCSVLALPHAPVSSNN